MIFSLKIKKRQQGWERNGSSKADRGKLERKEKVKQVWLQLGEEGFGGRQERSRPCRLGEFGSEG